MGADTLGNLQIDRTYLEQIIGAIPDIQNWQMDKVLFHVYDAVYIKYHQKFYQEYMMRTAVEQRMIKKNTTIDMMVARVAQLEMLIQDAKLDLPDALTEEEVINDARAQISKDRKEKA